MKIAIIDIDDTIGNLIPEIISIHNELCNQSITVDDWTSFNLWKNFGITDDYFFNVLVERKVLENIKPIEGSIELINTLVYNNYRINYITARSWHPIAYDISRTWLYYNNYHVDKLHIVPIDVSKFDYFNEYVKNANLNISEGIIIDDNPQHITHFLNDPKFKAFIPTKPWNKSLDYLNNYRINNLKEIIKKI